MTSVPRQRRDRTGEPVDDEPVEQHPPDCRRGWRGEDNEGRPRPCLHCRPHLAPEVLARAIEGTPR